MICKSWSDGSRYREAVVSGDVVGRLRVVRKRNFETPLQTGIKQSRTFARQGMR